MRVIVNIQSTLGAKTGIGHYTSELVRCLRERCAPGDVVDTFPKTVLPAMLRVASVVLPRKPFFNTGIITRFLDRYRQSRLRVEPYDIYHEPNFIPALAEHTTVTTIHDLSVLNHPEWHPPARVKYFEEHFLPRLPQAVHYLAISEAARQEIIRRLSIPPERITCTYMGVRPNLCLLSSSKISGTLRRLGLPASYLLCVGTIEPRKNVLRLMQAYCALPSALRERFPLVLAGMWGWKAEEMADYYDKVARHRGVRLLGYVADTDLAAVYNGARALLFPSLYEGFGIPPLEMMACGGAVIASTAAAVAEVAAPQAHLVHPEDVDGWRDAMQRVVTDDEWWQSLRHGAVEHARPFTWERCAAETLQVYRSVCGATDAVAAPALAA